jgi:Pyridoxamine 5'-phosphate oxidase
MPSWREVAAAVPELAQAVQERFDAHRHKTLATLRRDGAPRISGTEANFADGELWLGGMHQSLKCLDLLRDPRLALHSATTDPEPAPPPGTPFDAKVAGRALPVTDPATLAEFAKQAPPGPFHLFRVDVTEAVVVKLGDPADHLVIESWHEGKGFRSVQRR